MIGLRLGLSLVLYVLRNWPTIWNCNTQSQKISFMTSDPELKVLAMSDILPSLKVVGFRLNVEPQPPPPVLIYFEERKTKHVKM